MDNTAPDRQWVTCPGCAEAFDPDHEAAPRGNGDATGTVQCPFCSTRFIPGPASAAPAAIPSPMEDAPGGSTFFFVDDDTADETEETKVRSRPLPYRSARSAHDLSTARVRDLSASRRALLKIRSWCVVATASFSVAVVQLILLIVAHVRHTGWSWKPVAYAIMLPAAAFGVYHFARRVIALGKELNKPALPDPAAPPDFSTLSDGSQRWKNLGEM